MVDIVTQGSEVLIFIDMYTDGSRPAGDIVEDVYDRVHSLVAAEQRDSTTLKIRILGITRDHQRSPSAGSPLAAQRSPFSLSQSSAMPRMFSPSVAR
ncbi:hypothetical protein [Nesterenkonia aurantiaca]|uniref:Uncharacterized protein n=1 Tax=Nesterenkonia aurantiaca TaxID=1436010 RepID=A0A4R7G659_9MICC|nr:hypothetical protein [Nesterenkonia aurantiaca]TDS86973.1 hypothetical protein EV640_102268 [Nesterenkonia aurantiaca]